MKNGEEPQKMEPFRFSNAFHHCDRATTHHGLSWPTFHIKEGERRLEIVMDTAEFDTSSLSVRVDCDNLVITGSKTDTSGGRSPDDVVDSETHFERAFRLPKTITPENVSAILDGRELHVTIKRPEPCDIPIKSHL